jgi:hypothetical protein
MQEEAARHADEGQEKVQREEMCVGSRMIFYPDIQNIVYGDTSRDNDTLSDFNPIYAGKDVNGISAEDAQEGHPGIVHPAYVNSFIVRVPKSMSRGRYARRGLGVTTTVTLKST